MAFLSLFQANVIQLQAVCDPWSNYINSPNIEVADQQSLSKREKLNLSFSLIAMKYYKLKGLQLDIRFLQNEALVIKWIMLLLEKKVRSKLPNLIIEN